MSAHAVLHAAVAAYAKLALTWPFSEDLKITETFRSFFGLAERLGGPLDPSEPYMSELH